LAGVVGAAMVLVVGVTVIGIKMSSSQSTVAPAPTMAIQAGAGPAPTAEPTAAATTTAEAAPSVTPSASVEAAPAVSGSATTGSPVGAPPAMKPPVPKVVRPGGGSVKKGQDPMDKRK
jgi:hypothetical protein